MRPRVSASIYRSPTCRDGRRLEHRPQVWPSTASSAVRCTHVGPPTPIFLSFQFMVSCRSNASLVRASNLVCIRWFSWRESGRRGGGGGVGNAKLTPKENRGRRRVNGRKTQEVYKKMHTHTYRYNIEETGEREWDDTRQVLLLLRGMNDKTEVKALVDQSLCSRGRSHMHLCLPGAEPPNLVKLVCFALGEFFFFFYLYEFISLTDSLFQFFLFMLQDRTRVLLSFEFLKSQ